MKQIFSLGLDNTGSHLTFCFIKRALFLFSGEKKLFSIQRPNTTDLPAIHGVQNLEPNLAIVLSVLLAQIGTVAKGQKLAIKRLVEPWRVSKPKVQSLSLCMFQQHSKVCVHVILTEL